MMTDRNPGDSSRRSRKVLLISPCDEDHRDLRNILQHSEWQQHDVSSRVEALEFLQHDRPLIAICESELPDGTWKDLISELSLIDQPPALVVTSRLADETLWSEVLHLGGYNVVSKPLDSEEVMHVVNHAGLLWETRETFPVYSRNARR